MTRSTGWDFRKTALRLSFDFPFASLAGLKGAARSRPQGLVVCAGHYFRAGFAESAEISRDSDRERAGAFWRFLV